jgi:hypothetical protein
VVRWKPNRTWVVSELVEAKARRVANEHPKDPAPARQVADRCVLGFVDAGRQEPFELAAGFVDDAQRGIARLGQGRGGLDQLLEQRVE